MIKVDLVYNEKENTKTLYFESSKRIDKEELDVLDQIAELVAGKHNGVEYPKDAGFVRSECLRISVKLPKPIAAAKSKKNG